MNAKIIPLHTIMNHQVYHTILTPHLYNKLATLSQKYNSWPLISLGNYTAVAVTD